MEFDRREPEGNEPPKEAPSGGGDPAALIFAGAWEPRLVGLADELRRQREADAILEVTDQQVLASEDAELLSGSLGECVGTGAFDDRHGLLLGLGEGVQRSQI